MAVLVATALLLSAGGAALAGGSIGGTSGGADEFLTFTPVARMGGKVGGGSDHPVVNVEANFGTGMEDSERVDSDRGADPGQTIHAGSV
jgi:hypothetical protein